MQPQIDVSILVLGYNSLQYLGACLAAIEPACSKYSYEVLFVNNGTDGSEEFITANFPDVRILPSQGNVGFAAGNNYLAKHAIGSNLLLLNPDTELCLDAIDILLDAAGEHSEFQLFAGLSLANLQQEEAPISSILPTLTTTFRSIAGRSVDAKPMDLSKPIIEVEAVNGGFMMLARSLWEKLGGLDERYFLYVEDLDFCKRIKDNGGRIAVVRESKLAHDVGSGNPHSPQRILFQATGQAEYFLGHYSKPYAILCIAVLWFANFVHFSVGAVLSIFKSHYGVISRGRAQVVLKPWRWVSGFSSAGADPRRLAR